MIDPIDAARATQAMPGNPRGEHEPVFRAPWEGQAFAIVVALQGRGLFTWSEWAETLGQQIARAQAAGDPDTGATYYLHWLAALEWLVVSKGVTSAEGLGRLRDAWDRAAHRTPHGQPIQLSADDFS